MRVIAGTFRSRILMEVDGEFTRSTKDRVKEQIFNSVGPYFNDLSVLDLFAGSGSIGIEALSRGAKRCVFVDKEEAFSNEDYLNSTIKSILTSAIINGLDIIGVLSPETPSVGLRAKQMAQQQQMDIVVASGQTYICSGKEELYIYNLLKPVPRNLSIDKACGYVHDNNGFVLATNVHSKLAPTLNRFQGSKFAPDGVEIFNAFNIK